MRTTALLPVAPATDYLSRLASFPRVGFTTAPCLHLWRQRVPEEIVSLVQGARIYCHTVPPFQRRRPYSRIHRPDEVAFYEFDILRRIHIGAIEPISWPNSLAAQQTLWLSTEHLVAKKQGSELPFRTVYNGHSISKYLVVPPTKAVRLTQLFSLIPSRAWLYGYDLRDAFYSINVHPDSRHLLCFQFRGRLYRYRSLPQGISPSAAVLCEVTTALCHYWSSVSLSGAPLRIYPYFDDLNGHAMLRETAREHSHFVRQEIETLGLHWHPSKSVPEPTQKATILGYVLDTINMTAHLPPAKLDRLITLATVFLARQLISAREAASLAGRFMDARHASPLFRASAYAMYPHVAACSEWDESCPPSTEFRRTLEFLSLNARRLNGHRFRYEPGLAVKLVTDATPLRWTITILSGPHAGLAQNGPWSEEVLRQVNYQPERHINFLELMALWIALHHFQEQLRGCTLWWHVDNMVALAYLRKRGGQVEKLRSLTWAILERSLSLGIFLTPPAYLQSKLNPADYGTRHRELDSVCISRHTYDRLNRQFGPMQIDLFANSGNTLCPRFFSPVPDVGSSGVNALAQSWRGLINAWIFPPTQLLEATIDKLLLEQPSGILILPFLPHCHWWQRYERLPKRIVGQLQRTDFVVDGADSSSIFLSLAKHFLAVQIR